MQRSFVILFAVFANGDRNSEVWVKENENAKEFHAGKKHTSILLAQPPHFPAAPMP